MKKYQLICPKEGLKQFISKAEYSALGYEDKVRYRLILDEDRDKLINIIDTTGEPNILGEPDIFGAGTTGTFVDMQGNRQDFSGLQKFDEEQHRKRLFPDGLIPAIRKL